MKLAEALQERVDINNKIDQLRKRLENNCLMQEGQQPAESPAELMAELDSCADRLTWLVSAINRTNSASTVEGRTLTDMIAEKDSLKIKLAAYRSIVETAGSSVPRARFTEIRILPAVNVPQLQKKADQLAKQLRQLDNLLQASNWRFDLIEE